MYGQSFSSSVARRETLFAVSKAVADEQQAIRDYEEAVADGTADAVWEPETPAEAEAEERAARQRAAASDTSRWF